MPFLNWLAVTSIVLALARSDLSKVS